MNIIKCPECGHMISDSSKFCPECGTKIAGHIDVPQINDNPTEREMPLQNDNNTTTAPPTPPVQPAPPMPEVPGEKKGLGTKAKALIGTGVAVVVLGIAWFAFGTESPDDSKEAEAYAYAMSSSEAAVLQSYLDTYPDADPAHRDSIAAHLKLILANDQEWNDAIVSGTKSALEAYLAKHPDTPHKNEIYERFDSLDWCSAKLKNTVEGYQEYLSAHVDGQHTDEAEEAMKKMKSTEVQVMEKEMITSLLRRFFQCINTRNDGGLSATCEETLSSFLGKQQATKNDVVTFMNKLYKADVVSMNWVLGNNYDIKKREVGEDEYEYTVAFTAEQNIEKETEKELKKYKINVKISPDGKISEMNMVKIVE